MPAAGASGRIFSPIEFGRIVRRPNRGTGGLRKPLEAPSTGSRGRWALWTPRSLLASPPSARPPSRPPSLPASARPPPRLTRPWLRPAEEREDEGGRTGSGKVAWWISPHARRRGALLPSPATGPRAAAALSGVTLSLAPSPPPRVRGGGGGAGGGAPSQQVRAAWREAAAALSRCAGRKVDSSSPDFTPLLPSLLHLMFYQPVRL